jgi:hypothetical protein
MTPNAGAHPRAQRVGCSGSLAGPIPCSRRSGKTRGDAEDAGQRAETAQLLDDGGAGCGLGGQPGSRRARQHARAEGGPRRHPAGAPAGLLMAASPSTNGQRCAAALGR